MIIRFSRTAERDLVAIQSYIAEDNERAAERVITRILQSIRYLAQLPNLGRPGLVEGTRELSIAGLPYVAVYRIEQDSIRVLTVIHTRRHRPG